MPALQSGLSFIRDNSCAFYFWKTIPQWLTSSNNHFSAKSVANAAMIKEQLGQPVEGEYSEEFLTRFPPLAGVVRRADIIP